MTAKQQAAVEALDQPGFFAQPIEVRPLWFLVHEADAVALMNGVVTETLREQARAAVDWQWDALRRGERPIVPGAHTKPGRTT